MRRPARPASAPLPPPPWGLPAATAAATAGADAPPDGYVRLPTARLYRVPLVHLYSEWEPGEAPAGRDDGWDDGCDSGWDGGDEPAVRGPLHRCGEALAELNGHTEWAGGDDPLVSIGWDWRACWFAGRLRWMAGDVRSNLMLVDDRGSDLGVAATRRLLELRLAHMDWPAAVAAALGLPG